MRRERSDNIKVSLLHIPKLWDRDDQNRLCDYKLNTRDESPRFSLPAADTGETPHRNNHVHVIAVAVIFILKFINLYNQKCRTAEINRKKSLQFLFLFETSV